MDIIARKVGYAPDEAGNNLTSARPLAPSKSFQGVIGFGGDSDFFSIKASKDARLLVTFSLVDDFSPGGGQHYQRTNLDADVTLYSPAGGVLKTWTNEFDGVFSGTFATPALPASVRRPPACVCRGAGARPAVHNIIITLSG